MRLLAACPVTIDFLIGVALQKIRSLISTQTVMVKLSHYSPGQAVRAVGG
jgi:hypothetical protein